MRHRHEIEQEGNEERNQTRQTRGSERQEKTGHRRHHCCGIPCLTKHRCCFVSAQQVDCRKPDSANALRLAKPDRRFKLWPHVQGSSKRIVKASRYSLRRVYVFVCTLSLQFYAFVSARWCSTPRSARARQGTAPWQHMRKWESKPDLTIWRFGSWHILHEVGSWLWRFSAVYVPEPTAEA